MAEDARVSVNDRGEERVERSETGIRIALTLLFVIVAAALESALAIIIVFGVLWTLLTREPPSPRVRELANRIIAYYYRIGRYLTYNESRVPFPFSDFPEALEGDAWDAGDRESDSIGLPLREDDGEAEQR